MGSFWRRDETPKHFDMSNRQTRRTQRQLRRNSRKSRFSRFRNEYIGKKCPLCRCSMKGPSPPGKDYFSVTKEHVIPVHLGGLDDKPNIRIICGTCQLSRNQVKQFFSNKGDDLPDQFWYSSFNFEVLHHKRILEKTYSEEWVKLQEFMSENIRNRDEIMRD